MSILRSNSGRFWEIEREASKSDKIEFASSYNELSNSNDTTKDNGY